MIQSQVVPFFPNADENIMYNFFGIAVVVYNGMCKTAQAGTVVPENFFKLFQLRGQKLCKYIMT